MGIILRNIRPVLGPSGTLNSRIDSNTLATVGVAEIEARQGDVVVDGSGRVAFPGFINAHTHLPMVLLRGLADDVPLDVWLRKHIWPIEAKLTPEDIYWCTLLGIAESIRSGTTCVNDMYFHVDAVARAVEESGIRALLTYGMIADGLDAKGQSELDVTRRMIERWNGAGDGRIQCAVSPHSVYTCGEAVWREAIEMALAFDVPIHTHVAETRQEVESWRAKTGESPVAYIERIGGFEVPVLAAHCVHVSEADIAIMAAHAVRVAHCPKSNAKLGSGVAPVPEMREAGICVGIGTDGAASNNRLDMIEEMRAAWILQRGHHEDPTRLSSRDVVQMAVEEGRSALDLHEATFEDGNPADIVLLDATRTHSVPSHDSVSMLAYAAAASDVTDVIVDGRILMKDRELLTIDEERVQSEVNRRLQRLKT